MRAVLNLLVISFITVLAFSDPISRHRNEFQVNSVSSFHESSTKPSNFSAVWQLLRKVDTVELPLDHFGSTNLIFHNRYLASTEHYQPGGPVLLYDVGEGDAFDYHDGHFAADFLDDTSRVRKTASELGAVLIRWEHRFYGNSTPWASPRTSVFNHSAALFEFHTFEQALADIAAFAWDFSHPELTHVDLTPKGSPWVFIGASYPGLRASWMRQLYPQTVHIAYASSAPVQGHVNNSAYFDIIWQSMESHGFGNCRSKR